MLFDAADFCRSFDVSHETFDQLVVYENLLKKWQERTNLVGKASLSSFWERHVIDSAQLINHIPPHRATKHSTLKNTVKNWLDLGSGAGFPGLVIAIMSKIEVDLIEANGKKCDFLRAVIAKTGACAEVHQIRIENYHSNTPIDIISARALAPLPRLLSLSARFFSPSTLAVLHRGQNWQNEIHDTQKYWDFAFQAEPSMTQNRARILKIMHPIAKHIHLSATS